MENKNPHLLRAESLMDVGRFDQALQETQKALQENPDNPQAMLLAIVCYTQLNKYHRAEEMAREMLSNYPEVPVVYYYLGLNLLFLEELEQAEEIAMVGLGLAPNYVDIYALLGQIYLTKKSWEKALEYADYGLSISAQNVDCLNIRVQALTKLGRQEEMKSSMEDTLNANPNSSFSHANIGWAKLETKDYQAAKEHFAEALRLNPNFDDARVGLLEALKANNIFYRVFLNWLFWMSNQAEKSQWAVIIVAYFGFRVLKSFAKQYPVLIPVVFIVAFLFYLTWIMSPLFNLLIKLDKTARHALTPEESAAANVVGIGLFVGLSSFFGAWVFDFGPGYILGMISLSLVLPGFMYFEFKNTTHEFHGKLSLIALASLGIATVVFMMMDELWGGYDTLVTMVLPTYFLGFLGYQFAANYWKFRARPIN